MVYVPVQYDAPVSSPRLYTLSESVVYVPVQYDAPVSSSRLYTLSESVVSCTGTV